MATPGYEHCAYGWGTETPFDPAYGHKLGFKRAYH